MRPSNEGDDGYLPVIVIRLTEPAPEGNDLRELAKRAGYRGLAALLDEHLEIEAARAIQTVGPEALLAAEKRALRQRVSATAQPDVVLAT